MADAYSYALRVELEENNKPRLKNKLVKYFQSKKSNGGDCELDYKDGSRTAVLRFRREEGKPGRENRPRITGLFWGRQCRGSHNAHYALCVGHQVLRGHQKTGN